LLDLKITQNCSVFNGPALARPEAQRLARESAVGAGMEVDEMDLRTARDAFVADLMNAVDCQGNVRSQ
jgi:hypothetical protein